MGGNKDKKKREAQADIVRGNTYQALHDDRQRTLGDYDRARDTQWKDYDDIMGRYRNFSDTGGYSPEDLSNIRARSNSPIAAAYANANRNVNRQRVLQGGYAPNYMATQAKMAREMGMSMADQSTNTEAGLAQMVNQGKLAGNQGMAGMYSAGPGLVNTYGGQLNNNMSGNIALQTEQPQQAQGTPWWQSASGAAGTAAQIYGVYQGARNTGTGGTINTGINQPGYLGY